MVQELKLADDLFPGLISGDKRVTIRAGDRDIKLGRLVFTSVDGGYDPVPVEVFTVMKCFMWAVTDEVAQVDGADTAEELLEGMKRFYPDLDWDSIVTVVFYKEMQE